MNGSTTNEGGGVLWIIPRGQRDVGVSVSSAHAGRDVRCDCGRPACALLPSLKMCAACAWEAVDVACRPRWGLDPNGWDARARRTRA